MKFQQGDAVLAAVGLGCILASGYASAATVGLGNFVQNGSLVHVGNGTLPDPVQADLSGLAYNDETDRLFAVINGSETLIELQPDGSVVRAISLSGFDDTEGIVHLGGNRFGVVEERRRNFVIFTLGSGSSPISYSASTVIPLGTPGTAALASTNSGNLGIEGVAYDSKNDQIYVAWEKSNNPGVTEQEIRRFDLSDAEMNPGATEGAMVDPFADGVLASLGLSDLAGMHFVSTTDTLLILSHESSMVVEIDAAGNQMPGSLDLGNLTQPEGIAVGSGGVIYVVGEPDEFALFVGPAPQIPEPGVSVLVGLGLAMRFRRRR